MIFIDFLYRKRPLSNSLSGPVHWVHFTYTYFEPTEGKKNEYFAQYIKEWTVNLWHAINQLWSMKYQWNEAKISQLYLKVHTKLCYDVFMPIIPLFYHLKVGIIIELIWSFIIWPLLFTTKIYFFIRIHYIYKSIFYYATKRCFRDISANFQSRPIY